MIRNLTVAATALLLSACTLPNLDQDANIAFANEDAQEKPDGFRAVLVPPSERPQEDTYFEAVANGQIVGIDDGAFVVGDAYPITLRLNAWGREQLELTEEVRGTLDDGRVLFDHGPLTEWYESTSAGVEQGFDVSASPAGKGPLRFQVMLGGALAEQVADAAHIRARNQHQALEYGYLSAVDFKGETLPVYVLPVDHGFEVIVDDANAQYPIQVVPFIEVKPELTAAN